MSNRRDKCGNTSERCFVPALSGRHICVGSCRGKGWSLLRVSTIRWCRNSQVSRALQAPPWSFLDHPQPRGHRGVGLPQNVVLLLLSSLSHQFHPYTGVGDGQDRAVTGTPSPAPFPDRAGADMGPHWEHWEGGSPLSTLTPQGFKNYVTGSLCKKERERFLGHFCYNTRRACHGLEEWDILILR